MLKDMTAIVAAANPHRGIGYQGQMPWKLPGDMKHFKTVTIGSYNGDDVADTMKKKNVVIMGRKTWESIPPQYRPLCHRINVILTRQADYSTNIQKKNDDADTDDIIVASSLQDATLKLQSYNDDVIRNKNKSMIGDVFVMGGAEIYQQAIEGGYVQSIVYTEIDEIHTTPAVTYDAFFPNLSEQDWTVSPFYMNTDDDTTDNSNILAESNKENGQRVTQKQPLSTNEKPSTITTTTTTTTTAQPSINKATTIIDPKSGISYRFLKYTKIHPDRGKTEDTKVSQQEQNDGLVSKNTTNITSANTTLTAPSAPPITTSTNREEMQYLQLCRDIMEHGTIRQDRTGIGTISKFGTQMSFSLRNNTFPLLTTKRTFVRGVIEELLWFIKGSTNANELAEKDIHIWDGNGSREFLDQRGLSHRDVGDLGPVYGFQWRHYGAKYIDMYTNYTGQGFDQLADCIHKIKHQPYDRRIIMTAWNPTDLQEMALPPCHMFCQFYVDTDKNEVSCQMYQRSADLGLGVPFNIASYALLTIMIAHVTGRKPGDFIHTIGDAHVYLNHVDALKEQIQREPREFPKLYISNDKQSIDDFEYTDFNIVGYNPHKAIKMTMAV